MSRDIVWQEYMEKNFEKFIHSLKVDDFITGEKEIIHLSEVDIFSPKNTYDYLRKIITQEAIKKLQNRFRAHKHRERRGIKNLQLKSHSLKMLDKFKVQVGAETLEEAIDFLLSPDYRDYESDVKSAKEFVARESFCTTDVMIEGFASRLKNYDRERLLLIIELAFNEGWKLAKQSRKRTGNPKKEALEASDMFRAVQILVDTGSNGDS